MSLEDDIRQMDRKVREQYPLPAHGSKENPHILSPRQINQLHRGESVIGSCGCMLDPGDVDLPTELTLGYMMRKDGEQ